MPNRVELVYTDSDPTWEAMEAARGDMPRASWIKRAVEAALSDGNPRPSPAGREARSEVAETPARTAATARQGAARPAASPQPSGLCKKHGALVVRSDGRCGAPGCPG